MAEAVRSCLPVNAYGSEDWLARERTGIFARHWQYAGTCGELSQEGDFVTCDIGPGVVVRRFSDGLRCFRNVCSHRGSRILSGCKGHGPLQCRYHGWTYDSRGRPVGLPGRIEDFGLTPVERDELALTPYCVDQAGPFVFVKLSDHGPSLAEYLGPMKDVLTAIEPPAAAPAFDSGEQHWNANWKLGVENTLESLHADFVHGDSLAQVFERGFELKCEDRHSSTHHHLQEASRNWWNQMTTRGGLTPGFGAGDYWHFFIYPNLCLGLTNGTLLSIQTFHPAGVDRLRFRYQLHLPPSPPAREPLRRALADFLEQFNTRVIEEDRPPVEDCQQGIAGMPHPPLLARSEARVDSFQRAVLDDMRAGGGISNQFPEAGGTHA